MKIEYLYVTAYTLIIFLLCSFEGRAQLHYFNHYQVENGLSNNSVLCSIKDKDGFMWFGTRDGLNRFDGYRFKQFYADIENEYALGSNFIHSLAVDKHNTIWIGTDQGLFTFCPQKEQFKYIKGLAKREILKIEEDHLGHIWIVATNQLFVYNPRNSEVQQKTFHKDYWISSFCFGQDKQLWIGAGNKLLSLTTGESHTLPSKSQHPNEIKKLSVDRDGNIWIGTSKEGLFKFDITTQDITQIIPASSPTNPLYVRDILQTDDYSIWIATEGGVYIYYLQENRYELLRQERDNPWGLTDNAIYTLSKDHQGGIWVGSYFGGIHYYHKQHTYFEKIFPRSTKKSIQGQAIREMVEDQQQNLWIGTEDQGLNIWNRKDNTMTAFPNNAKLSHSNIHGLAIIGDSLLVGTFHQGMNVVSIKTGNVIKHFNMENTNRTLSNDFVYSIYTTRAGKVLLATARGVYEFFPGKDKFQVFKPIPSHIFYTSIYEDKQGNLWLSTWRDGLFKLSQTGDLTRFIHEEGNPKSLNGNRVNKVFEDSTGRIWVATESGIAIWREGNIFERITKHDGLPSDLILGFEEDLHRNIWISTTNGLVKMPMDKRSIELFDTEKGLLGLQFNYNSVYKDKEGYLYFGSSRGLIRFNPQYAPDYFQKGIHSPIYITGIQTHQRDLVIGGDSGTLEQSIIYAQGIVLNYDESTISIDFAALNYVSSKSTSYRYRLLGLDSSWTFLRTNDKAYFTKIPPGKYTFQVVATDGNGTPISNIKSLQIKIKPPFWASATAYSFYTVLVIAFICFIIYAYDNRVKEKNRRRLEVIKNHKEQELYRAKMDFFMRVTHDIKTPLTLIKAPLEKIMHGHGDQIKTTKWLNTIQQNTEKLITLTDNLLDFRKIESENFSLQLQTQNISSLLQICLTEFMPLVESKQIKIHTQLDEKIEASIDIETIYKIVSNLLFNAIKYADKNVSVSLYGNVDTHSFHIEVQNDGTLLSEAEAEQIFKPFQRASAHYRIKGSGLGLALAYSFAKLHGGSLRYAKNSKKLNIFVLEIPI